MIPTIPGYLISVYCLLFAFLLFKRVRSENNNLLWGKIGALVVISIIYILVDFNFFDLLTARAIVRLSWVIYLTAEIAYHHSKVKWTLKN